jgi:hypothetical protein
MVTGWTTKCINRTLAPEDPVDRVNGGVGAGTNGLQCEYPDGPTRQQPATRCNRRLRRGCRRKTKEMLKSMKRGAVLVDVAIDQGGCFETSHAATHADPTYEVDGMVHYCVANMPGAVPLTSSPQQCNPSIQTCTCWEGRPSISRRRSSEGWLNVHHGCLTHKRSLRAWGLPFRLLRRRWLLSRDPFRSVTVCPHQDRLWQWNGLVGKLLENSSYRQFEEWRSVTGFIRTAKCCSPKPDKFLAGARLPKEAPIA